MPPTNEPNPATDRRVLAALRRFDTPDYSVQSWGEFVLTVLAVFVFLLVVTALAVLAVQCAWEAGPA